MILSNTKFKTGPVGFEPTITDLEGRCLIHTRPRARSPQYSVEFESFHPIMPAFWCCSPLESKWRQTDSCRNESHLIVSYGIRLWWCEYTFSITSKFSPGYRSKNKEKQTIQLSKLTCVSSGLGAIGEAAQKWSFVNPLKILNTIFSIENFRYGKCAILFPG